MARIPELDSIHTIGRFLYGDLYDRVGELFVMHQPPITDVRELSHRTKFRIDHFWKHWCTWFQFHDLIHLQILVIDQPIYERVWIAFVILHLVDVDDKLLSQMLTISF